MLIMSTTSIDFQGLADSITKDFYETGVPLEDGITKVAQEKSLNPEEITRLVEKTNTAASIWMLKTAEHKKDSFALASVTSVLNRTHLSTEPAEKTASAYRGLPVFSKIAAVNPLLQKTASVEQPKWSPRGTQVVFTVRKELESKKLEKVALEHQIQDKIDYLASEFNTWRGPGFEKFAGDCYSVFGVMCAPVVDGLAKYLRIPASTLQKEASADYVDDTTPHMQAMRSICSGLSGVIKLADEISELEDVLKWSWALARRGAQC